MILSAGCEYGIQALLYLESLGADSFVPVATIARDAGIPHSFLAKIAQVLVARGILTSGKGPGGGIALARPASEITLLDIVRAIDGLEFQNRCVLGFPQCNDRVPCPVHSYWGSLREDLAHMFAAKSLHAFALEMNDDMKRRMKWTRKKR